MNIEQAKAELLEALSGPAGRNWGYGHAVKALLDELAAKDAELQEYRKGQSQPVAWLVMSSQGQYVEFDNEHNGVPLYTAPQPLTDAERAELQEYRKAASQPIGWTDEQELRSVDKDGCGYLFKANPVSPHADPRRVIMVYAGPKPGTFGEHAETAK